MHLFLKSNLLKNAFTLVGKISKILFLFFMTSLVSTAHASNIDRCTGKVVSWNNCYNSVKFVDSKTWALGEWKNGSLNGMAIMSWENEGAYVGEVQNGKFHGYGAYKDADSSYVGDFFEGKKHGLGRSFSKDGAYIGGFKHGSFHGNGIFSSKKPSMQVLY
jgi:hypothetical protein